MVETVEMREGETSTEVVVLTIPTVGVIMLEVVPTRLEDVPYEVVEVVEAVVETVLTVEGVPTVWIVWTGGSTVEGAELTVSDDWAVPLHPTPPSL